MPLVVVGLISHLLLELPAVWPALLLEQHAVWPAVQNLLHKNIPRPARRKTGSKCFNHEWLLVNSAHKVRVRDPAISVIVHLSDGHVYQVLGNNINTLFTRLQFTLTPSSPSSSCVSVALNIQSFNSSIISSLLMNPSSFRS